MKIGDKIYCYNNTDDISTLYLTIGKEYFITNITNKIYIDNDNGYGYIFSFDSYGTYFYTDIEMRKKKLERLGDV